MTKTKWYAKPIYLMVVVALVLSLGALAVLMIGTVAAAVIFEHYNSGDDWNSTGISPTDWHAQTFTAESDHSITSVRLKLWRIGSPGIITVSIKGTDASGLPTGGDLTSGTTDGNTLTTDLSGAWREITLTSYALNSGTKYAIGVKSSAGGGNMAYWRQKYVGGYANGNDVHCWIDIGTVCQATTSDCMFEVWGPAPPQPDLIVEKTASWEGGTLTVNYTVTNNGGAGAGATTTCVYVNGTRITACDNAVPALGPGATHSGTSSCSVDCPCSTSIEVVVCADCDDAVAESNEDNNCTGINTVECPPCPPPDLVVEKTASWEGGTLTVNYTVINNGDGSAGASTTCVSVNGTRITGCDSAVPALGPGATHSGTSSCSVGCPCGTSIEVVVCADCDDAIAESNEDNNCTGTNIVDCPPCLPDLVVSKSVAFDNGNFIVSYSVTNNGDAAADASTTCKYVGGEPTETQPCPTLDIGESHSGTFAPEPCCPCGATLEVEVCADNDGVVAEIDEDNNCEVNYVECPVIAGVCCSDPDVTITDQGVTDDPASDPGTYDPTNMPPDVTWEDAKGFYIAATGPDGCYEFFARFETPVNDGFTLYKLPAWEEWPYTKVEPNTIRVELCINDGVLDPAFVLAGTTATPPVGGEAYPVSKLGILAPWIALVIVVAASGFYLFRRIVNKSI